MKKNKFTSLITNFFKNFTRSNKSEKVNEIIAKNLNSDFQLSKKQLKLVRWANNHPLPKSSKKISKNTADNIIEFFKVSKYYLFGSVVAEVFKDISFSIKRGEFAILYGKSGSGKIHNTKFNVRTRSSIWRWYCCCKWKFILFNKCPINWI